MLERGTRLVTRAVVAAILALVMTATPSLASFPGGNGRIAFEIDRDVFTIAPDGTDQRQLTADVNEAGRPAWSPDGSMIAFEANRVFPEYDVFLMDADGSYQRAISPLGADDGQPAFSPDGRRLVFLSKRGGQYDLWTMAPDGSDAQRLTDDPGVEEEPAWSPDGRYITFDVGRDIYIMNADGSGRRLLTGTSWEEGRSTWAPDSSRIAFETNRDDANYEIYTIRPDGTELRRITNSAGGDGQPAFSPDGRQIAFLSNRTGQYDLWVMNADGSDPVRITDSPSVEREPDWQPLAPRFVISDFEYPVDPSGVNVANAGQSIPLRYRLTDANGALSDDPAHFISVTSTSDASCGTGTPDAIETYAGDSGLRYLGNGYWQFNWKTPKSYAGQCRSMTLNITSGAPRSARFRFQ
jgi:Tol biopolymer transport system component